MFRFFFSQEKLYNLPEWSMVANFVCIFLFIFSLFFVILFGRPQDANACDAVPHNHQMDNDIIAAAAAAGSISPFRSLCVFQRFNARPHTHTLK